MAERVLLLMPTTTYRATDFLDAAERLRVEVVVGTDRAQALGEQVPGTTLALDFTRPDRVLESIVSTAARRPLAAVVGVDDETTVLAAMAARALGLRHNSPDAARAARNKHDSRRRLAEAGLRTPPFRALSIDERPEDAAAGAPYPCVLKPLSLSASRGVLRADDPEAFVRAFRRVGAILREPDVAARSGDFARQILVEGYIPGREFALEGLLVRGTLRVLALFDKPDPLEGPTFEETLYVTPSRLPAALREAVAHEAAAGCRALGLEEGPVHAELRVDPEERPWILEIAARSIGGFCSRALRFGAGVSLEELILRHALGRDVSELVREDRASGVLMLPIPKAGVLRKIEGVEAALEVAGVDGVTISIPAGEQVVPLPEGHRYLGFVFASAGTPEAVEAALRGAQARLRWTIDPSPA